MTDYIKRDDVIETVYQIRQKPADDEWANKWLTQLQDIPSADVRENITAHKVIGGGEHDGSTCWFECSACHGTVDIEDAYCKHCGAQMER